MKNYIFSFILFLFYCISGSGQVGFEENIIVKDLMYFMYTPTGIEPVDMDNDGDLDVLFSTASTIGWFENIGKEIQFSSTRVISDNFLDTKSVYPSDVDGDGDKDVIAIIGKRYGSVIWFENLDGEGNFGDSKQISGIGTPKSIHSADLDGDGDMDILSASKNSNYLDWYENLDGKGNFSPPINISYTEYSSRFVFAADIDGDGDLDVISAADSTDKVVWYENLNGTAEFGEAIVITDNADGASMIRVADLDGDSDLDVLSVSEGDHKIAWYENINGDGDFGTENVLKIDTENGARAVFPADVDGDGDIDVISSSVTETVWQENIDGYGNFSTQKIISLESKETNLIQAADFDGDGHIDILSSSTHDHRIAWQENLNGVGDFGNPRTLAVEEFQAYDAHVVDIDGDGHKDIVTATDKGSIWDGTIAWQKKLIEQEGFGPPIIIGQAFYTLRTVNSADIDGDGDMDIISSSKDGKHVAWFENMNGLGDFSPAKLSTGSTDWISSVLAADVDGDGDMDIVCSSETRNTVAWFENFDGNGAFGAERRIDANAEGAKNIYSADFDGDGDIDLVCAMSGRNTIYWYKNSDGNGNFSRELLVNSSAAKIAGLSSAQAADIDGDGDMDIIGAGQKIVWSENTNGEGSFTLPITITEETFGATLVYPFDADNDGDIDLVVASKYGDKISWLENIDGQGNFSGYQTISEGSDTIWALDIADIDNDANMDLVSASSNDSKVSWYKNLGKLGNNISGLVRLDIDANGCETTDFPMSNLMIVADNGVSSFATFTNENGYFQIPTNTGTFISSISTALPTYYNASPINYSNTFIGDTNNFNTDFCLSENQSINDLNVTIVPTSEARPGFDATYQLVYSNVGTTKLSGSITLTYDENKLVFLNANEVVSNQVANILSFDYVDLNPMESRRINLTFNAFAPPTVNIDEVLTFNVKIDPSNLDHTIADNEYNLSQTIIGSYDPNDITLLEGDKINISELNNYLQYVVRFQNTGTASAINVRVNTKLDENLDWNTFQILASSHQERVEIRDGNKVSFVFDDINLSAMTYDEPASHGYIAFKIKPKAGIAVGDIINGTAAIYFDFNAPIITNTASTIFVNLDSDGDGILNEDDNCPDIANPGQEDGNNNGIGDACENAINPFLAIADQINTCPFDGTDLPILNLCGNGILRTATINTNSLMTSLVWEKLDESSCALTDENCKNDNLFCTWNTVSTSSSFTINEAGEFRVTVNYVNGSFQRFYAKAYDYSITASSLISNNPTTEVSNDGEFTIDITAGDGPFEYQLEENGAVLQPWQSEPIFSGLPVGNYIASIRNAAGCSQQLNVVLVNPTALSITANTTSAISCSGVNDAIIEVEASGGLAPYTYELFDSSSTSIITSGTSTIFSNLVPGNYYVVVTDANSNSEQSNQTTITEPLPLTITIETEPVSCFSETDGGATFTVQGGLAPYQFSIDAGTTYQTTNTFSGLAAGNYEGFVRDAFECSASVTFTIDQGIQIQPDISSTAASCSTNNGTITIAITNPSEYLYSVSKENNVPVSDYSSNTSFNQLAPGNYYVSLLHEDGCMITEQITIASDQCDEFTLPVDNFNIEITSESCASSNNGSILLRANEPLDYTAILLGGTANESKVFRSFTNFQDLEAGSYELCITIASETGYQKCFTLQITEPESLSVDAKTDTSGKTVTLSLKGSTSYFIKLNGMEYTTSEGEITLPLSNAENNLRVRTNLDCQGIYENTIITGVNELSLFPNPVENGDVTILLPTDDSEEILLTIFSQNGIRVLEKMEKAQNKTVRINLDHLPTGFYTIIITTDTQNTVRKIIKK